MALLPKAITYILFFLIGCYGLITILDMIITRAVKRCIIEIIVLIAVIVLLNVTTGFPSYKQGFGGVSLIIAIGIMLVCTVLGMSGRYVFYQGEKLSRGSFLRT